MQESKLLSFLNNSNDNNIGTEIGREKVEKEKGAEKEEDEQ